MGLARKKELNHLELGLVHVIDIGTIGHFEE
jgi:hypothetical protein